LWPLRVRYSKRAPQPRHSYSKRGIEGILTRLPNALVRVH
jgi:hypothetical protein